MRLMFSITPLHVRVATHLGQWIHYYCRKSAYERLRAGLPVQRSEVEEACAWRVSSVTGALISPPPPSSSRSARTAVGCCRPRYATSTSSSVGIQNNAAPFSTFSPRIAHHASARCGGGSRPKRAGWLFLSQPVVVRAFSRHARSNEHLERIPPTFNRESGRGLSDPPFFRIFRIFRVFSAVALFTRSHFLCACHCCFCNYRKSRCWLWLLWSSGVLVLGWGFGFTGLQKLRSVGLRGSHEIPAFLSVEGDTHLLDSESRCGQSGLFLLALSVWRVHRISFPYACCNFLASDFFSTE